MKLEGIQLLVRLAPIALLTLLLPACERVQTTAECNARPDDYQRYDCMRDSLYGAEDRAIRSAVTATLLNGAISYGTSGAGAIRNLAKDVATNAKMPEGESMEGYSAFQAYWSDLKTKADGNTGKMQAMALADANADAYRLSRFVAVSHGAAQADQTLLNSLPLTGLSTTSAGGTLVAGRQAIRHRVADATADLASVYRKVFLLLGLSADSVAKDVLNTLTADVQLLRSDAGVNDLVLHR